MYGIIYKATNIVNGKVYIGLTKQGFEERKYQHKNKSNKQENSQLIYKAIRKYGWDNFEWEIIDNAISQGELVDKEIYWIDFYNSYAFKENPNGYNMTIGGESTNGLKLSNETKKKISKAMKGESNPNYGKIHSDETIEKIRNKKIGSKASDETKEKLSKIRKGEGNGMYEKNHSDETKDKISKSHTGKKISDEVKQKISTSNKGKSFSEEHKQKISESKKGIKRLLGENHGRSKLTENDVRQIRELHSTGWYSYSFLGKVFGVGETTVKNVVVRKTWSYI